VTEDKQSFTPASEGTANPPLPEPESALPAQAPEQDLESFEETESFADDDASARPSLELVRTIADGQVSRAHLKGLLEALIFVSDQPIKANDLAKTAAASSKLVRELLVELKAEYAARGIQLDEVAGAWIFRSSVAYAPFVRDLAKQKPVRLTRAQVETLAILAYRQPITRPEVDDIRGVDCGPVLKLLLERDLVRILGRKDEPGRPMLYGTTAAFLEFFGLRSLKDLPTLREFTELSEDSRRVMERELGDVLDGSQPSASVAAPAAEAMEVAAPREE
jgi:segregation and condensation protein B